MIAPTRAAVHYITEEPEKIVRVMQRDEKKAIEAFESAIKYRNLSLQMIEEQYRGQLAISSLEEGFEHVTVKKWNGMLSSYHPLIYPTPINWHWDLGNWMRFQNRTNHFAQKYAALQVFETLEQIHCVLWSQGKRQNEWDFYTKENKPFGEQFILLSDIGEGKVFLEFSEYIPEHFEKSNIQRIQLLLPCTWREDWKVIKQTQLMTICE